MTVMVTNLHCPLLAGCRPTPLWTSDRFRFKAVDRARIALLSIERRIKHRRMGIARQEHRQTARRTNCDAGGVIGASLPIDRACPGPRHFVTASPISDPVRLRLGETRLTSGFCSTLAKSQTSSSAISGAWSEQRAQARPCGTCMSSTRKPRT